MVFRFRARPYVYLLPKQFDEQVAKLHFRALWEHEFMALVGAQVKALDLSTVPFGACGFLCLSCNREFGFSTACDGVQVFQLRSVWTSLSLFQQQWVRSSEFAVERAEGCTSPPSPFCMRRNLRAWVSAPHAQLDTASSASTLPDSLTGGIGLAANGAGPRRCTAGVTPASVRTRDRRTEARTGPGPLCPRNGRPHPSSPGVT